MKKLITSWLVLSTFCVSGFFAIAQSDTKMVRSTNCFSTNVEIVVTDRGRSNYVIKSGVLLSLLLNSASTNTVLIQSNFWDYTYTNGAFYLTVNTNTGSSSTNGLASISYVDNATQNLVTASITNGLVTDAITNGLASIVYVDNATQNLVTVSVTNGLASITYVDNVTQGLTNIFAGLDTTGLVTSSGSDVGKYLKADGTWDAPSDNNMATKTNWGGSVVDGNLNLGTNILISTQQFASANMTYYFSTNMTTEQIQDTIDSVPKIGMNKSLSFIFSNGVYNLTTNLTFIRFVDYSIVTVQGEDNDATFHTNQACIFSVSNRATQAVLVQGCHNDTTYIKDIDFRASTQLGGMGLYCLTTYNLRLQGCKFTGTNTVNGYGGIGLQNHSCPVMDVRTCAFDNLYIAISTIYGNTIVQTSGVGPTIPYKVTPSSGGQIHFADTNVICSIRQPLSGGMVVEHDGGTVFMDNGTVPMTGNINLGTANYINGGTNDNVGISINAVGQVTMSSSNPEGGINRLYAYQSALQFYRYSTNTYNGAGFVTYRGRGQRGSTSNLLSGDTIGYVGFIGTTNYSGNPESFSPGAAYMFAVASGNWGGGSNGTRLNFQVTTNGSSTPVNALDIQNDRALKLYNIGNGYVPAVPSGGALIYSDDGIINITGSASTAMVVNGVIRLTPNSTATATNGAMYFDTEDKKYYGCTNGTTWTSFGGLL